MYDKYYEELRNIFTDVANAAATSNDYETSKKLFRIAEHLIEVRTNLYMDMACDRFRNGYQE